MKTSEAWAMVGGLSKPGKMPGWSIVCIAKTKTACASSLHVLSFLFLSSSLKYGIFSFLSYLYILIVFKLRPAGELEAWCLKLEA